MACYILEPGAGLTTQFHYTTILYQELTISFIEILVPPPTLKKNNTKLTALFSVEGSDAHPRGVMVYGRHNSKNISEGNMPQKNVPI